MKRIKELKKTIEYFPKIVETDGMFIPRLDIFTDGEANYIPSSYLDINGEVNLLEEPLKCKFKEDAVRALKRYTDKYTDWIEAS